MLKPIATEHQPESKPDFKNLQVSKPCLKQAVVEERLHGFHSLLQGIGIPGVRAGDGSNGCSVGGSSAGLEPTFRSNIQLGVHHLTSG